ncbi:MAG: hypothetical protein ABSC48_05740 [Terracidiphilus sp.]|jgi:hypothetical protein
MPERTIENRLREEYFDLLPVIRQVTLHLETIIRYRTLSILRDLKPYEQVVVKSRVKEYESAKNKLLRPQEGDVFDPDKSEEYSILKLRDLAGVRVLVFPHDRLKEVDQKLGENEPFKNWTSDPVKYARGFVQAPKYYGFCSEVSHIVQGEYQIIPMLIGHFWEVEHSAMYKPAGWAKGADKDHDMKTLRAKVECSLLRFEREFERFAKKNAQPPSETP